MTKSGASAPFLVVVNNAPFGSGSNVSLAVEPPTGAFLEELAGLLPRVIAAQGVVDLGDETTPSTWDLATRDRIEIDAISWRLDGRRQRALSYLRALPWVLNVVRRTAVLHIFLPGHLPMLFVAAARLLGKPYGVYLRGEVRKPWLGYAISGARFVITANEGMQRAASHHSRAVSLVAPMVDLGVKEIAGPRPPSAQGPWRLLFVGRIEQRKGVSELLRAVRKVQGRRLPIELDLVGWAAEIDHYRLEAERLGVINTRFHGAISDRTHLFELYSRADLFVLPTHSEGFPRVLYEAMASGIPILTTFVGGIPAVMKNEVNCLRIPAHDADGLASVLERALRDGELRAHIASGGTTTIRQVLGAGHPSHAQQVAAELSEDFDVPDKEYVRP